MSETSYRRDIRSASRGLWTGVLTYDQFFDSMLTTIREGLTNAWETGFKRCGLTLDDMTADERAELERRIVSENTHLGGFSDFILANSRANNGLLRNVFDRAELWINRYKDLVNHAKTTACADQKLKWVWNPMKEHCSSCRRLNGRVYRASVWKKNGVQPQNPPNTKIECGGWRCGCEFEQTNERITPGPFPALP